MSYGHPEGPGHHDHGFHHHPPPVLQSHEAHGPGSVGSAPAIIGDVVKIYSEAGPHFNLTVRGSDVVVATANDSDPFQQWIKDESWSNKAKDSAGLPAFALINVGSGKALRHAVRAGEAVLLDTYHQNSLNEAVLWTLSTDHGKKWHAIRPVNNIDLNVDIDHATKKYGGVKDGAAILLFEWKDEGNQKWQIATISASESGSQVHDHHHRF